MGDRPDPDGEAPAGADRDGDGAAATKRRLESVEPVAFEHLVADLLAALGWETEVTRRSRDAGVDVVATRENPAFDQRLVVQAKRRGPGNPVGRPAVQQCRALVVQDPAADAALLVTSGRFTGVAREWADANGVRTVDGDDLAALVGGRGLGDVVARYADVDGTAANAGEDGVDRADDGAGGAVAARPRDGAGGDRHPVRNAVGRFPRATGVAIGATRSGVVRLLRTTAVAVRVAARVTARPLRAAVALLAVVAAWLLCLSGVGERPGLWLLARLPRVVAGAERWALARPEPRGSRRTRLLYATAVGWWLGLAVAVSAWALAATVVGLPAARRLAARLPTALRLSGPARERDGRATPAPATDGPTPAPAGVFDDRRRP